MMFKWLVWGYLKAPRLTECYLFRVTQSQLNSSLIIQGFFFLCNNTQPFLTAYIDTDVVLSTSQVLTQPQSPFIVTPFSERSLNSRQVKYLDLAFIVDEWHRDILYLNNLPINCILSNSSILIVRQYEVVTLINENGMFSSFNKFIVL